MSRFAGLNKPFEPNWQRFFDNMMRRGAEDTIENICDAKRMYGDRIAVLGGMDVDFLCRAEESEIRKRVRDTVEVCQPGGGFCLGTGNTVANYIPLDNYLVMVDESRRYLS